MTAGKVWIGNALNTGALQSFSGDATLATNGALTLANSSQARTDLGLGSAATLASTAFLQPGNNLSDVGNAPTSLVNLGGASLTASNTLSGGNSFTSYIRLASVMYAPGTSLIFTCNPMTIGQSGGDAPVKIHCRPLQLWCAA